MLRPRLGAWLIFGAWIVALGIYSASAQIPAFPGALGFGGNATGGRAGTVYHVTTLANSGAGSFRDAVSKPNRIVVFDVGGYINITSEVAMNDHLTIAGETAPGGGIGIMGNEVSCGASTDIIIRHVRFRPGSSAPQGSAHCLNMYGSTNIIVDHVSFEFGPWNNIGGVNIDQVTIQNCLVADPINQQFGAHIEHLNSSCAFLYNIWSSGHNRQPLATINTIYINNVIYNYQAGFTTHTSGSFFYDILNNYFITGPASTSPGNAFFQVDSQQSIYASGNLRDSDNNSALGGSVIAPGGVVVLGSPWSALTPTIPTYTPATAYRRNVSGAGAWPRDQVDELVVSQVKTLGNGSTGTGAGTAGPGGGLYSSQTQTGLGNNGFGILNGGIASIDTDNDGMPDYWEKAVGLDFNSNDAMILGADGYANIEKYLHWLADAHALTVTNTPTSVDLWQYTSGFTNAAPVYSIANVSNGVAVLTGHTVQFTPVADVSGLGGFEFAVVASGTAYTNRVNVLMSPITPPSNLVWQGDGLTNLWANGDGTNWLNGTNLVAFASGDNVTFDDTGSNSPAINLTGPLPAGTVYVLAQQDYTFGGDGFLSGGTVLFKTGSGTLFLNTTNTATGGVTINDGIVQVGDGVSLSGNLNGSIINNDTLIFANPGTVTSSAGISGSGTLTKNGAGMLMLSGNQSFTNLTTINAGTLRFSGTPPAGNITNAGVLTFNPSSSLTYAGIVSGPGLLTVGASSQTVTLTGANTFTGGINVTAGNLQLAHNNAAGTGPVTNSSSGLIYVGNGVVITNDLTYISSTTDLNLRCDSGTGVWAGNVVNLGSGASWRPGSDGGTLVFTGTALQGARNFIVPRGSVQFASNAVVSATGTATAFGRDGSAGNRSANVTIKDNAVVTLGVCNLGGNQAGGNVTLTLQNNAVLNCGANNFDLQNVNRTTAQTFIRLNGGTLTVGGFTKTKTSQTNSIAFNGGMLKAGKENAAFLPALNNSTNLVQAGGVIIDDGGFAISLNAPLIHDPALGATVDGGLTKAGNGITTIYFSNTYNGPTVINAGTLKMGVGPSLGVFNSTNIYIATGAVFDLSYGFAVQSVRKIWGNGTVIGNLTITNGAMLEPGTNDIGSLTFNNALTLAVGSTSRFELGKTPLTNDTAKILGTVSLGGTLIVTNLSGTLAAGDSFKLFDSTNYTGAFANVELPPLKVGLVWNTNQLNSAGLISVVAKPPLFGSVSFADGILTMTGSNGPANGSYYVLTSTNLTLPRATWDVLATNPFDAGGNFTFTNSVDSTQPQKFYLLQLP